MQFGQGETVETVNEAPLAKRSISAQMHTEDDAMAQDLATGHITPKTYNDLFEDKSTLGKLGTVFGLLVGGMGSGLAHQPNALMAMMDKTIERDLDAQKASATNRQNFYKIRQQQALNDASNRLMKAQADTAELGNVATRYGLKSAGIIQDKNGRIKLSPSGELQVRDQAKMDIYNVAMHDLEQKVAKMPPTHPLYAATVGALNDIKNTIAQEKQQMSTRTEKAHQAEEDAHDPVARLTGISRSKVPMPEIPPLLHPNSTEKFKGLSAYAAASPVFRASFEDLKGQYQAAAQADKALETLVPTFQNLARLRTVSGRIAREGGRIIEGIAGTAGTLMGAKSGNPAGGAYIGESIGSGASQALRAMTNTEQNRVYDLEVNKLSGLILNAMKSTNMSHDQADAWARAYAPIAGDDDHTVKFKLGELVEKIKTSVPTNLLRDNGMLQ